MIFILPTITERELKNGDSWEFSNDDGDILEISFSKNIQHHTGRGFCLWINGEIRTFKTIKALRGNAATIIEKNKLKLMERKLTN